MEDIELRVKGRAGRVTLKRPNALNALTWDMCLALEAALDAWRDDPDITLVVVDAVGEKAFCAGGDLDAMYRTGLAGDFGYGRRFWADEYRLNAKIAGYPKPYVAFMQGFTMGGGVGVSCHGSHRIVGQSSRIAMPECGIGLIPDVGGSHLLARSGGGLGEYLGTTGYRMDSADAIHAGFADYFIPQDSWGELTAELERTGDAALILDRVSSPGTSELASHRDVIDAVFADGDVAGIIERLDAIDADWAVQARKSLSRQSPLSVACAIKTIRAGRNGSVSDALAAEYRFTYRCMEHGDFVEGIRAQIIDKDLAPKWRHADHGAVSQDDIDRMTAPLGEAELKLEEG